LKHRVRELEREIYKVKQAEKILLRQNEYLTVLNETSLGLIDHLTIFLCLTKKIKSYRYRSTK